MSERNTSVIEIQIVAEFWDYIKDKPAPAIFMIELENLTWTPLNRDGVGTVNGVLPRTVKSIRLIERKPDGSMLGKDYHGELR